MKQWKSTGSRLSKGSITSIPARCGSSTATDLVISSAAFVVAAYLLRRALSLDPIDEPLFWTSLVLLGTSYFVAARRLSGGSGWKIALCLQLIVSVMALGTPVRLTGDIPRYVWEGQLVREGINPFVTPPSSAALPHLRDGSWSAIEYKDLPAIYPPAAQYLFAIFAHSETTWRAFIIGCCCISTFLGALALRTKKIPEGRVAWLSLNPLLLVEGPFSLHLDAALIPLVLLVGFGSAQSATKPVVAALGFLVKYPAMIVMTPYLVQYRGKALIVSALIFTSTICLAWIPFFDASFLFGSLGTYLQHWRYNDFLLRLSGELWSVDWTRLESFLFLKRLLLGAWLFVAAALLFECRLGKRSADTTALALLWSYLFVSPVVHPWYLLAGLPLLLTVNAPGFALFTCTVCFSYVTRFSAIGELPLWLLLIEYLAPVALLWLAKGARRLG